MDVTIACRGTSTDNDNSIDNEASKALLTTTVAALPAVAVAIVKHKKVSSRGRKKKKL